MPDVTPLAVALAAALAALLATWAPMIASMKNRLVDQIHRLLSGGQRPGVDDLELDPAELVPDLLHAMGSAAVAAAGRVVEEAADQGVSLHPAHIPATEMGRHAHDAADEVTVRLRTVAARAVEQAAGDATLDEVVQAARSALDGYGDAGQHQLGGNAMHGAMTTARIETYRNGPVGAIYASEKNDNRTCEPCHEVDGRWLGNTDDMAQIQLSYPGGALGGYVYCEGGYNCRGTITGVWRKGTNEPEPTPAAPPTEPERPVEPTPAPEPEPTPEEPAPEPQPESPLIGAPTSEKGIQTRQNWEGDAEHALKQLVGGLLGNPTTEQLDEARVKLAAQLRHDFAGKQIATRMSAATLRKVLKDGRFKTQHETGKSSALFDPELRGIVEDAMFGIAPDADPTTRPIYAYLAMDDVRAVDPESMLNVYGDIRVVFKNDIRSRTTATIGDSLFYGVLPSPVDDPTWESANTELRVKKLERGVRPFDYAGSNIYVEAQILGGVSTDDIEVVILAKPPTPALRTLLEQRGIPWEVLGQ